MKWFMHHSDLSRDEGISRYLDAAGRDRLTAYGFLMFVLEAIASRMNAKQGHLVCTATYSIPQWARITYSHPNRVTKYLRLCEELDWVHVEIEEGSCKVSIPKMVEWRDEYTRKSGVRPDKVAHNTEDESKQDKRESKDDGSLTDGLARREASRTPPHDFEVTPESRQWAEKERPDIDIDYETKRFLLHTFSSPRNNWDSEWKKWILGANTPRPTSAQNMAPPDRNQEFLGLAKLYEIDRKSGESENEFLNRIEHINRRRIEQLDG